MPRFPRNYIKTSYFHVIVQGINKTYIFDSSDDKKYYIKNLYRFEKDCSIDVIAYCIMDNHAHMLLKTSEIINLSKYMHKINTLYAKHYNKKYNKVGYVFRDRYKSEGIYSEEQLYNCIKYIYNNPVKAKICSSPEEYMFSNFKPVTKYYTNSNYIFIDISDDIKSCKQIINDYLFENRITLFDVKCDKKKLRELLILLKDHNKISLRQIANELEMGRETLRNIYRY